MIFEYLDQNYDFSMEFLTSAKLGHADGLSRLIPKSRELLEDTVIASLQSEKDYTQILCNTIKELPVTLEDSFIKEMKQKVQSDELVSEVFSMCNEVLLYRERVVIPATLQKKILKDSHTRHLGATRMKSLMRSYVY